MLNAVEIRKNVARRSAAVVFATAVGMLFAGCRPAAPESPVVVADSVAGFSGRQGNNGWSYGYWDRSTGTDARYSQATDFRPLARFGNDPINRLSSRSEFSTGELWTLEDGVYYTSLWAAGGHANSATKLGRHQAAEHWAVRRWVSTIDGPITISGRAGKVMPWGENWQGICRALIVVDGAELFSASMDNLGKNYSIDAEVSVGSIVDFLIGPGPSVGVVEFTATIRTRSAPTPAREHR
ncbi:MAG: hypothetical protein SFX72_21640 [Isosphaeraceae bacterium]|nr:hypothetical protein [Isosphaeraceae bacterium]